MIVSDGVHITSGISIQDLHVQMARIGIKRCWFHSGSKYPHYDAPKRLRGDELFRMYPEIKKIHSRDLMTICLRIKEEYVENTD